MQRFDAFRFIHKGGPQFGTTVEKGPSVGGPGIPQQPIQARTLTLKP